MFPVRHATFALAVLLGPALAAPPADAVPTGWRGEWPQTDFGRHSVPLEEITSGGPPKDGIPSIDDPSFVPVAQADLPPQEPVMGLVIGGDARAYPLRILMWHEIVNDVVEGVPVAVTYCPLCNTGLVFDRRVDGRKLEFGTTGKLRHSDLVMYDRGTESWWQQFLGEAIVGELTGTRLKVLPSQTLSWADFKRIHPGECWLCVEWDADRANLIDEGCDTIEAAHSYVVLSQTEQGKCPLVWGRTGFSF
jgi:hypothetical protein